MGFEGQWGRALGRDSRGSMRADTETSAQTRWKCRHSLESADIQGQERNRERIPLRQLGPTRCHKLGLELHKLQLSSTNFDNMGSPRLLN